MKPNFLLLGATKSGTTTLSDLLDCHPEILISRPKEPGHFHSEAEFSRGMEYYWKEYFYHWRDEPAIGDCTTTHFYLPFVTERIANRLPDAKLIVILRNPVNRAFSHWWMLKSANIEKDEFPVSLRKNLIALKSKHRFHGSDGQTNWNNYLSRTSDYAPTYLDVGHYATHIENYLGFYDRSKLLVLQFEELLKEPNEVIRKVCDFLEVSSISLEQAETKSNVGSSMLFSRIRRVDQYLKISKVLPLSVKIKVASLVNSYSKKPHIDNDSREFLKEYYFSHNQRLSELLGRDFSHWNL